MHIDRIDVIYIAVVMTYTGSAEMFGETKHRTGYGWVQTTACLY